MTNDIEFFSQYCERTANTGFAEPINTLSNIAFIVAGILAWKILSQLKTDQHKSIFDITLLFFSIFLIGLGSALWHTIAKPWAELVDVIPILFFISIFILSFLYRIVRMNILMVILFFLVFQLVNTGVILYAPKQALNGSLFYAPTALMFVIFAGFLAKQSSKHRGLFYTALGIFSIAIVFRTVDQQACQYFPIGTHFIWHILVATVLYLVFRFLALSLGGRHQRR